MNTDTKQWPDLASRSLGGSVIAANDELFADRENLIKPGAPVFQPHTFGNKGQIMDGWETRRRREAATEGHGDSAIVRLGCAGVVRRVVVDTSYFTGNYPPEVAVEACGAEGYPAPADLAAAQWTTLVPRSTVAGDARNEFDVTVEQHPRPADDLPRRRHGPAAGVRYAHAPGADGAGRPVPPAAARAAARRPAAGSRRPADEAVRQAEPGRRGRNQGPCWRTCRRPRANRSGSGG